MRTDRPEAELGLLEGSKRRVYIKWQADRNLSADIHKKLTELFDKAGITFANLTGIVFYKGPGSFTGLRIGASVANTIAYELDIPIVGTNGETWIEHGVSNLRSSPNTRVAQIEYGAPPRTTTPKK